MRIHMLMDPKVQAVVFDLDGTLVEGMPFELVIQDVAVMAGRPFGELMSHYQLRWTTLEDEMAYHVSLVGDCNAKRVLELYDEFIRYKSNPDIVIGAEEVLGCLKEAGKGLVCWTRGKDDLQRRILRTTRLERYFDLIIVVPNKNEEAVKGVLLPALDGLSFAMIGDSYEQDMLPVKDVAFERFWITGSKANTFGFLPFYPDKEIIKLEKVGNLLW
jgi:phosphoserine phosphatase